jgi:hypothetical protein
MRFTLLAVALLVIIFLGMWLMERFAPDDASLGELPLNASMGQA